MALPPIPPRIVSLTVAFDILALFGAGIILCALLSAIFSSGVKRTAGWYSVMVGWLIYALTWGFLSINRMLTKPPPLGFCAFEMVLVNAAPVLTSFNMLCYYIEFYYIVANLRSGNLTQPVSTCCKIMLVVAPWIVFIATVVEVLLVIFLTGQLSLVEPTDSSFHCRVGNWTSSLVGGTLIAIAMIISIPLQGTSGQRSRSTWPPQMISSLDWPDLAFQLATPQKIRFPSLPGCLYQVISLHFIRSNRCRFGIFRTFHF
ncbi:hypothetical protein AN958_06209 [Leucoagaricus sp. SymC.cos]|nr:hypothetical protein AN958_06209 [Leucoagaricus sp. SymC.cos]